MNHTHPWCTNIIEHEQSNQCIHMGQEKLEQNEHREGRHKEQEPK